MPRYYFHIRDEDGVSPDSEGCDLPDLAAARIEARASARDLMFDCLRANKPPDGRKIEIAGENGAVIETIALRDLLH